MRNLESTVSKTTEFLLENNMVRVAATAVNRGDYDTAKGALALHARNLGAEVYREIEPYLKFASPEAVENVTKDKFKHYSDVLNSATMLELFNYFSHTNGFNLSQNYELDELRALQARMFMHKDKTFGEIKERLEKAEEIIKKSQTKGHQLPPGAVEEAFMMRDLYRGYFMAVNKLMEYDVAALETNARKTANETVLKNVSRDVFKY
ncbi:hypothetical protein HYT25_00515 [Candidatus Pacearchaeota archaeon]|nr:hypothetical protein [Candidatus Pacearchaeota archaeon]